MKPAFMAVFAADFSRPLRAVFLADRRRLARIDDAFRSESLANFGKSRPRFLDLNVVHEHDAAGIHHGQVGDEILIEFRLVAVDE